MQFSSRDFTYDSSRRMFIAEMSTLDHGGCREIWHRVYDDAADAGIKIVSARTGLSVTYAIANIARAADGSALYWDLLPVKGTVRSAQATSVRIFND